MQCKKMVFKYGPMILIDAEQFLESNDICTILHACDSDQVVVEEAAAAEWKLKYLKLLWYSLAICVYDRIHDSATAVIILLL